MSMHGLIAHVSADLAGRSLMYAIFRTSPGDARITGATVAPLKAKASRPFLFTACSVRATMRSLARTSGASGRDAVWAQTKAARNISAPISRKIHTQSLVFWRINNLSIRRLRVPRSFLLHRRAPTRTGPSFQFWRNLGRIRPKVFFVNNPIPCDNEGFYAG